MLPDSEKRAAALAVSRYAVDRRRVQEAARAVMQAQTEGHSTSLVDLLVVRELLSPSQAAELRQSLDTTSVNLGASPSAGQPAPARASAGAPKPSPESNNGDALSGVAQELRRLGGFRLLRRLGEGGMGAVYLGYQEAEGRQVAIKVLPDQLAKNQSYIDRFYREARSVALLDHPNIVRGIAVGRDQETGKHYLVLEYVDGPSVHTLLDRFGRLAVGDAVHIVLDIARALEHAHSRNIVHRDIKPDNILLTRSGVAKLADLGLARRTDESSHLTGVQQGFGTPYYMPYEQALNAKQADGRSDIYALGATLYHLVTGQVPFPGNSHLEVAEKKNIGTFARARSINPAVPESLDAILRTMMARAPEDRYQTASELIVVLERSRLAAPVPSFVDPDLALQDPLVRARLTAPAQPTQPDLDALASKPYPRPHNPDLWYVRYRNREGRWCKTRATTQQIVQRLRAGRFSIALEACHQPEGEFRPLREYPEFGQLATARARRLRPSTNGNQRTESPAAALPTEAPATRALNRRRIWLASLGATLLVVGTIASYLLFGR